MNILLTGGAGYIGSHTAVLLLNAGHKVFIVDNFCNSHASTISIIEKITEKTLPYLEGDIRDTNLIIELLESRKIEAVVHLAGLKSVGESAERPLEYYANNVQGSISLLQAMQASGVDKLVFSSSATVYGSPQYLPIDEKHLVSAQSPYAASKIAADQIALSYHRSFDVPVTIIRPFNTFGPRQSLRAIIPTIVTQLIRDKNIKLGSLYPTRDLTYIDDTTDAFLAAIKKKKDIGEIINIGSGFEISIKDLVIKILKITGLRLNIKQENKRIRPKKSEVNRLFADTKKAKKLLNWSPKYSKNYGFEKSLKKTIEWFSEKKNLDHYKINILND
jgi:dTDP-glucose 4,6-dehydratase